MFTFLYSTNLCVHPYLFKGRLTGKIKLGKNFENNKLTNNGMRYPETGAKNDVMRLLPDDADGCLLVFGFLTVFP